MIDPDVQKYIDDQINSQTTFTTRKMGDTPTDANQLVPKQYCDSNTLAVGSIFGAKGDLLVGTAPSVFGRLPVGTDGYVLTAASSSVFGIAWEPIPFSQSLLFGNGTDGAANFDGNTSSQGDFATRSSTFWTLSRDVYLTSATVAQTFTLDPAGYRIFVNGTLIINGEISGNGNAGGTGGNGVANTGGVGAGGIGGVTLNDGYLKGSLVGAAGGAGGVGNVGAGANGNPGNAGANTSNSLALQGSASGGAGGQGGQTPTTGGSGGGGGTRTLTNVSLQYFWGLFTLLDINSTGTTIKMDNAAAAGSGGGGGGGNGFGGAFTGGGGGGGGGGGSSGRILAIYAKNLVIGASGSIHSNGGVGGDGGTGAVGSNVSGPNGGGGGGGGGAGGNGGQIVIAYNTATNATTGSTILANGGAAGSAGTGGAGSFGGVAGTTGNAGSTGGTGTYYIFMLT